MNHKKSKNIIVLAIAVLVLFTSNSFSAKASSIGVGSRIEDIFVHDSILAQVIADEVASGNTMAILTQPMVDGLTQLDANNEGISDIRGLEVFNKLERLSLADNKITNVPVEIGELVLLKYLNLNNNNNGGTRISSLPNEISSLSLLEQLWLSENSFTEIPISILSLTSLKIIHFSSNQLTEIPSNISNLVNLETLDVSHNKITEIAKGVGSLNKLKEFRFNNNKIQKLPNELTNLTNLNKISAVGNQIMDLPTNQYNFIQGISDSWFYSQTYSEPISETGIKDFDFTYKTIPAHTQFDDYGVSFGFRLTKPDLSVETITVVISGDSLTIKGTDLDQVGNYSLLSVGTSSDTNFTDFNYTQTFVVQANIPPVLSVPSVTTINDGEYFDPMAGVSASDKEDGNLTSKVVITSNDVNVAVGGNYTVEYSVTDAHLATTTAVQKVVVNYIDKVPTLSVPKATTIKQRDEFDPMIGVSAIDKEDGDLTSKVKVIDNNVDTSKVGNYIVNYSVLDSYGHEITAKQEVTVLSNQPPVLIIPIQPKIVDSSYIGDLRDDVSASDKEDGDLSSEVIILSDDGFDAKAIGNYTIEYSVTDSDGNSVKGSRIYKVINDSTLPNTGIEINLTPIFLIISATLLLIFRKVYKTIK